MAENSPEKPNFYELLCVDTRATKEDIKKAYRKQALLFHPDKMKPHMKDEASEHFQLISEAYEVLSDDSKRELYDRYGHEGVKAGGNPNPEPEIFNPNFPGGPQGFPAGFSAPFFSSFGMPANPHFQDPFASHHAQHMRGFERHMESMFNMFPPPMHSNDFFGDSFGTRQQKPTLFETSPFAGHSSFGGWPSMGGGGGGGFSSTTSSSSFGGRGGTRSSTKTTIVNGMRTTVTEVTDAQGVTTTTTEYPDGTKQVFVDGVPASIEGSSASRNIEGSSQRPIPISDDNEGWNSGRSTNNQSHRPAEVIVLDDDEDDDMYEDLSHRPYPRRNSTHIRNNDPNMYHPRMGHGQSTNAVH
ncbi:hypothetical protein BGZ76_010151 [Entomortierella beljakovae]|nr:hypothetical protein BGZ76_010151 [Entomortierella beljakovae]